MCSMNASVKLKMISVCIRWFFFFSGFRSNTSSIWGLPDYSRRPSNLLLRLFSGVHFISFSRTMFCRCCPETNLVFSITWCSPQSMHLRTHCPVHYGGPLNHLFLLMCTPQSLGIPLNQWCTLNVPHNKLGGAHWCTSVVAFNCLSRGRHLGLNNLSITYSNPQSLGVPLNHPPGPHLKSKYLPLTIHLKSCVFER